jgi:hypothetical protein
MVDDPLFCVFSPPPSLVGEAYSGGNNILSKKKEFVGRL